MPDRRLTCATGRAVVSAITERELFSAAAGRCQRPEDGRYVFEDAGDTVVSIGEMAHIIAAVPGGPRGESDLAVTQRASLENLILLCANCHTLVDGSPEFHTADVLRGWKRDHIDRINALFAVPVFASRSSARGAIEPLLLKNRVTFERYGPESEAGSTPESDAASIWQRKVLEFVIPTNRNILRLIDANSHLLRGREPQVREELRQHVDDLEARHIGGVISEHALRFPKGAEDMFAEEDG